MKFYCIKSFKTYDYYINDNVLFLKDKIYLIWLNKPIGLSEEDYTLFITQTPEYKWKLSTQQNKRLSLIGDLELKNNFISVNIAINKLKKF